MDGEDDRGCLGSLPFVGHDVCILLVLTLCALYLIFLRHEDGFLLNANYIRRKSDKNELSS